MKRYFSKHKTDYNVFQQKLLGGEKYNTNPIIMWLNNGFMDCLYHFVKAANCEKAFEIGCGEGQLIGMLYGKGIEVAGMDIDNDVVKISKDNFAKCYQKELNVMKADLFDLNPIDVRLQGRIVICCEVLEHIPDPDLAVEIISCCTDEYAILSVPREPIWRIMNIFRGKYLKNLGDTPGHINHWTRKSFIRFVSKHMDVIEYSTPLPWTMLLCKKKNT